MCESSEPDLRGRRADGLDCPAVGGSADDVLGDGKVDDPARAEAQVEDEFAGAEDRGSDAFGEKGS